jgi:hypothetical protein
MPVDLSSTSSSDIQKNGDNNLYIIIIVIIIIIAIYYFFNVKVENMTGGTLTQLFANDAQDTYIKSNVDELATGKFNLFWNQPTRIANTFLNRGSPVPATYLLPNNNEISMDNIINSDTEEVNDILYTNDNQSNNSNMQQRSCGCSKCGCSNPNACLAKCKNNPSSCGNGAGGYRLETGFVDSTTQPSSKKIEEQIVYPDSYVGSYFINPKPDIMEPYPIIINRV